MKILLATDGSVHSDAALDDVIARPWPEGSSCRILCIAEPQNKTLDTLMQGGLGDMAERAQRALEQDLRQSLAACTEKLQAKFGAANVISEFLEGNPRDLIVTNAKTWGANLIVLGSRGASAARDDSWLGGVARAVMTNAPCAVELLQPTQGEDDKSITDYNYLLCVNNDQNARAVADLVLARPWPQQSTFQVLSVIQSLEQMSHSRLFKTKEFQELASKSHEQTKLHAEGLVARTVARLVEKFGMERVQGVVVEGSPRNAILQSAQDWPADMIIMGSDDGDSSMLDRLFGSTAAAVVWHAPCSVELVNMPSMAAAL